VAAFAGFIGLLFMAMPLTIVGGSFHHAYMKLEKELATKKEKSEKKSALLKHLALKKQKSKDQRLVDDSDEGAVGDGQVLPFQNEQLSTVAHLGRCSDLLVDVLAQKEGTSHPKLDALVVQLQTMIHALPSAWEELGDHDSDS